MMMHNIKQHGNDYKVELRDRMSAWMSQRILSMGVSCLSLPSPLRHAIVQHISDRVRFYDAFSSALCNPWRLLS